MARFGVILLSLHGLTLASLTSSRSILASKPRSYSALGDSYATGAGAGSPRLLFPHLDIGCGRFSDAYPIQLANSTALNVADSDFRNLACGGASTSSVLHDQVPWIREDDIVTVTVGGNEVDFALLLNECIYKWHPLSTCEAEWRKSRTLIESGEFVDNYEAMVKGTVTRLKPDGGTLFVTGYARFFNEETVACDHASFSTRDPGNTLTRPMRRRFNDLIRSLNDVIRAATETHGATYVDIDRIFEGHRFCEDGVEEPDVTRSDTWFFNTKNVPGARLLGSNPEATFTQQGLFNPIVDFMNVMRTFHPTSLGHKAIKDAILRKILDDSAVR